MNTTPPNLKHTLADIGVSKTIYALVTPETEATKNAVFDGDLRGELQRTVDTGGSLTDVDAIVKAVHRSRQGYFDNFREAWTEKQDALHQDFFKTWLDWVKPISPIAGEEFKYQYPTAGASEGLRAAIEEYGNRARDQKFDPEIFVFNGEYEGYEAYAKSSHIALNKTNRADWPKMIEAIAQASKSKPVQLYISQPSAIDGNVWPEYDDFMKELAQKAPNAEVILDLTYVGCIAKDCHIDTSYPNIQAIAFSLSKPMGAYYDRIGGFIAKEKSPGQDPYGSLVGNKWFKNLTSLMIGTEFMHRHAVQELPRKYTPIQQQAINQVAKQARAEGNEALQHLSPSDVYVLATAPMPEHPTEWDQFLARTGHDGAPQVRACLTPFMARTLGTAKAQALSNAEQDRAR